MVKQKTAKGDKKFILEITEFLKLKAKGMLCKRAIIKIPIISKRPRISCEICEATSRFANNPTESKIETVI